jgi:hypothetical protein
VVYGDIFMNNITQKQDIKMDTKTEIGIDIINIENINIEKAKELFNSCRYNEAEQIFTKLKGSDAAAWRILCHIITGDIGKRGGKIQTLLQESMKNQDVIIGDTITSINKLINEYESAIDRKTKNNVISQLYDIFNHIMKEKMIITINDTNKRALQIVKDKGYTPSIYDDKTIPLKVLNSKLKKHKYRIRNYKPEDIEHALKIINNEKFIQEVVDEYMLMAYSNVARIEQDNLDTRNQDILKYIRSLYISNIAHEKELRFTRSLDKLQFIDILNKLNERGWVRITMSCTENTRHFNMANDEEKSICEMEIEKAPTANVVVSLIYEDIIERRGFLIYDGIVNQISKEDIVIGDVTDRYTHEYVGPVPGIIYYDN